MPAAAEDFEGRTAEKDAGGAEGAFQSILSSLPIGVLIHRQGKILFANEALLKIMGGSWDEFRDRSIFDFLSGESRALAEANMARRLAGEMVGDYEVTIETLRHDSRTVLVRAILIRHEGSPALLVALLDITERKRAEVTFLLSEARYREMFHHINAGVAVYEAVGDGEDFILRDLNPAGERISRISREEAVGGKLLSIFPEMEKFGLLAALREVFRTGRPKRLPAAYYEDARRRGWRENYLYKLPSGEVVGIYEDITERKQAEERERALADRLHRQEKDAAIGTLACGVAHEINNPLNGIMNYAQLLMDGAGQPEAYAAEIMREAKRAANIVRSLLAFSRPMDEGRLEIPLTEIFQGIADIVEDDLRSRRIRFEVGIPAELPRISCNLPRIQQVLLNLIVNAREALEDLPLSGEREKRIRLEAREGAEEGRRRVRISVEDNGPGIPDDIRDRVFDPFFTTKSRALHSGLGLALSQRIVEEHGGRLWVESESGGFTRFSLDLPLNPGGGG